MYFKCIVYIFIFIQILTIPIYTTLKLMYTQISVGTRGDVQPFIQMGTYLQNLNYSVSIVSLSSHKDLVESRGLEFKDAGLKSLPQRSLEWQHAKHISQILKQTLTKFKAHYSSIGEACYKHSLGSDVLLVTGVTQSFGLDIGEKLNIPVITVKYAPDIPTHAFPPPTYHPSKYLNKLKWYHHWTRIGWAAHSSGMSKTENAFRKEVLDLGPMKNRLGVMGKCPTVCAYSPTLFSKPVDYPEHVCVSGFWDKGSEEKKRGMEPRLTQFCSTQKDVWCLTFGSMQVEDAFMQRLVDQCLDLNKKVVVISASFVAKSHIRVCQVDSVSHDALFPLCSVVIHHGGAGTSAAALRNACFSYIVPILEWSDQPMWGQRVQELRGGQMLSRVNPVLGEVKVELKKGLANEMAMEDGLKMGEEYIRRVLMMK